MEEIWKDIPGYEGIYQISNFGIVKRNWHGVLKDLAQEKLKNGYFRVTLSKKNKTKRFSVHRLVAITFLQNPNNYPIVMHLDDDKTNNHVNNLMWGTHQDNVDDMVNKKRNNIGSNRPCSKLTNELIVEIRNKYKPIEYSTRKLAKEYGVRQSTIHKIISNKAWKHI